MTVTTKGAYKPIVKFSDGRTLVVEQSPDRFDRHTRRGIIEGNKFARGATYHSRDEAIAAAQSHIDRARADVERRAASFVARGYAHGVVRLINEHVLWGGDGNLAAE